jgi:hypothetical protein
MNTTFKTLILAAAGAALIAVAPASAQTHKRGKVSRDAEPAVQSVVPAPAPSTSDLWQYGETNVNPSDTYGQIRDEYLKDAPSHNGNSY